MITIYQHEHALEIIEQFKRENNIEVSEGDTFKIVPHNAAGAKLKHLSVGKEYTILRVQHEYRFFRIAVAIRGDDRVYRWYSFDYMKRRWRKLK